MALINPRLRRTLLVLLGAAVLYFGGRSCLSGSTAKEGELEKRVKVEQTEFEEYYSKVNDVLDGLPEHKEYANVLLETGLVIAGKGNSYSDGNRRKMWEFAVKQLEKNPELTDYLGPNAKQYMKRKAINQSANKVIDNVYDGIKEGVKIIKGEKK